MNKRLQVYIEDEDYAKLMRLIEASHSDVSKMVRAILKTYLSKRPDYV